MALTKFTVQNAQVALKTADFETFEFARLAHLNSLIDQINASAASATLTGVPQITGVTLVGTTTAALRGELETRLLAIEAKLNTIITALS